MFEKCTSQYDVPCVAIEPGDKSEEVIAYAKEIGAVTYEGRDPVLVVQFEEERGPECYSELALARSFRKRYERFTPTGVKVVFFTEDDVPEGAVKSIGDPEPPRGGLALTVAPVVIGNAVIQGFSVRTFAP